MEANPLISQTAKVVALMRAESGIPYCSEIAELCDAKASSLQLLGDKMNYVAERRSHVEMRFKSLSALVQRHHLSQVLEIASGVSPRGLIFTEDSKVTYVETDLPDILAEKRRIVEELILLRKRPNYHFIAANALSADELWRAAHRFTHREHLAVIHEGLIPYLGTSEKERLASNIHELTIEFSGVWITPDIYTREKCERLAGTNPLYGDIIKNITGFCGIDMMANRFKDFPEAESFFNDSRFRVTRYRQLDLVPGIAVTTSNRTDLETEEIWVMTPFN